MKFKKIKLTGKSDNSYEAAKDKNKLRLDYTQTTRALGGGKLVLKWHWIYIGDDFLLYLVCQYIIFINFRRILIPSTVERRQANRGNWFSRTHIGREAVESRGIFFVIIPTQSNKSFLYVFGIQIFVCSLFTHGLKSLPSHIFLFSSKKKISASDVFGLKRVGLPNVHKVELVSMLKHKYLCLNNLFWN